MFGQMLPHQEVSTVGKRWRSSPVSKSYDVPLGAEHDKLSALRQRDDDGYSSQALAEYAVSIGVLPTGHAERGWTPAIAVLYDAKADTSTPVW